MRSGPKAKELLRASKMISLSLEALLKAFFFPADLILEALGKSSLILAGPHLAAVKKFFFIPKAISNVSTSLDIQSFRNIDKFFFLSKPIKPILEIRTEH